MKRFVVVVLAFLLLPLIIVANTQVAKAVTGNDWQAGRIIADSTFTNASTMSVNQIQEFLNAKVPTCDSNHSESSNWRDMGPPYICLKNYREDPNVPIRDCTKAEVQSYFGFGPSDSRYETALNYCWWKDGRANIKGQAVSSNAQSAARIILNAAQDYNINPQVLLVTLQKEQSLLTDTWPWVGNFQKAMGYACPDTAACDPAKRGFYNQVRNAAAQFRRYLDYPQNYNFAVGSRYIQYNPNSGCGGSNVNIQTGATAALYNYTPYQPNAAALNNLYGTGDGCSAYGNRNFWRMFNDMFGSTQGTPFFRINGGAAVYILGSDNNYYHLPSYELLAAYGYPSRIPVIDSFNSSYIEGRTDSGTLPRAARFEGSAVYLIDRGLRRWFSSGDLMTDYGMTLGEEAKLPSSTVYYYTEYGRVQPVAVEYGGSATYSIEDGHKRHITSYEAYQTGSPPYATRGLVALSGDLLSTLSNGPPIYAYATLFRLNNQDAVYLINGDNTYVWIPSKAVAAEYGLGLGQALNLSTAQAAGYSNIGMLGVFTKKPGGSVWLIQNGSERRFVSSEMLGADKYNLDPADIPQFPESFILRYKATAGLSEVIQAKGDSHVYLVENGHKRWAGSWAVLNSRGYDQGDLTIVSSVLIHSLPNGANLN